MWAWRTQLGDHAPLTLGREIRVDGILLGGELCPWSPTMTDVDRLADLPDFESPPLDEVVIAAYFNHIEALTLNHQILFWQRNQKTYGEFSVQQPVMVVEEDLKQPPGPAPIPAASIQRLLTGTVPRLWLESEDGSFLLQLQSNMFTSNWRSRSAPYPRFEVLLDRFVHAYADYKSFLAELAIDPGPTTMLDVTYVNWVPEIPMQDVVRVASAANTSGRNSDPWPAAQGHTLLYQLRDEGESVGRLSVDVQSAKRPDGDSWIDGTQMTLVARVTSRHDVEDMKVQYAFCRDAIVQTFADLTTEGARQLWRQR